MSDYPEPIEMTSYTQEEVQGTYDAKRVLNVGGTGGSNNARTPLPNDALSSGDINEVIDEGEIDPEDRKGDRLLDKKYEDSWTPEWLNQGSRHSRWITRLIVIGIAVGLLWLTCFQIATQIAELYVVAPSYDSTVSKWEFVVDLSESERITSAACVNRQLARCNSDLNNTFGDLIADYYARKAKNAEAVQNATTRASFCNDRKSRSMGALSDYLRTNIATDAIYTATCTPDQKDQMKALLGDFSSQKGDIYQQNVQYTDATRGIMQDASNSIANRTAYDLAYWSGKTSQLGDASAALHALNPPSAQMPASLVNLQSLLANYTACVSLGVNATEANGCPGGVGDMYAQMALNVNASISEYQRQMQERVAKYDNLIDEAKDFSNFVKPYISFANSISSVWNTYSGAPDLSIAPNYNFWVDDRLLLPITGLPPLSLVFPLKVPTSIA